MKTGDVVHGYTLLEDFRVVGAGLSEWTFAEREGRAYFLKRFLSPTYPDDAAPGSPATKQRKRAKCAAFESHHRGIQAALAPVTSFGGNLIATLDFFREGAKYYKVTEMVDLAGLTATDVARLQFPVKLVLLKTVAHSLKILHDLDIVHSDLKPSNVLIKRTEFGYTTKLIDFDSSYIVGSPPPPDEIVGTMNYYSPELVRYIQGTDDAAALTAASDVFALGLIYAEYLTGALPVFDAAHRDAAIAVLNGSRLALPPSALPRHLTALIERMLAADPAERPTVGEIHTSLMALGSGRSTAAAPLRPPPRPATAGSATALRGKGVRLAGLGAHPVEVPASKLPASPERPATSRSPATPKRHATSGTAAGSTGSVGRSDVEFDETPGSRLGSLVGKLLTRLEKGRSR